MNTDLLSATLIYDGTNAPIIPSRLLPAEGEGKVAAAMQMIGTPLERLCEIAGRCCYDSFGRGRTSLDFHKHILEVGHLSVVEHAAFTVSIPVKQGGGLPELLGIAACFHNKPSVWIDFDTKNMRVLVTLNLRHVLEWGQGDTEYNATGAGLVRIARELSPTIMASTVQDPMSVLMTLDEPVTPSQAWVTLLLTGSRGFSHELVRHGDWTAISQRSTRYVDESESPWVAHPLIAQQHAAEMVRLALPDNEGGKLNNDVVSGAGELYRDTVGTLEPWLISKGVDKTTARKQARGAARGFLGNALYTEVVFSASCAQWLRMLKQRLNAAADAEIREVFAKALVELKRSAHGRFFSHLTTKPSPDGIGEVLT